MKKIIAVILTISFLAVTPAQADDQDRPAQAASQDRSEKADRPDRQDRSEKADRQDRSEKADRQDRAEKADREDVTSPSIVGGILTLTQSIGGGIPCCLV